MTFVITWVTASALETNLDFYFNASNGTTKYAIPILCYLSSEKAGKKCKLWKTPLKIRHEGNWDICHVKWQSEVFDVA